MVKPFLLTYLSIGGGGGGGGRGVATPSLNLNHCLSDLLLIQLTFRPILGLPEYKLKVVNICEMHGTGGCEVVLFDKFQRYIEIVRKLMNKCYNSFIFQFNDLKSTG